MTRILFMAAMVLSVFFFFISFNYLHLAEEAESDFYTSMTELGTSFDTPHCQACEAYTENPGKISLFFFLFFIALSISALFQFQSKSMKVLSVINLLSLCFMIIWDTFMIHNAAGISFTEVGPLWIVCAMLELTFSIVGCSMLIQTNFFNINQKQTI